VFKVEQRTTIGYAGGDTRFVTGLVVAGVSEPIAQNLAS